MNPLTAATLTLLQVAGVFGIAAGLVLLVVTSSPHRDDEDEETSR